MSIDAMAERDNLRAGLAMRPQQIDAGAGGLTAESPVALPTSPLTALLPAVQRITQDLFPGPFSCSDEFDPEYPEDCYVVVNVESPGDAQDLVRRRCLWHERVRTLSADLFGILRLSITPR